MVQRRTPWHLLAAALLLTVFAVWCVWLVVSVRAMRSGVEWHVRHLTEARSLADSALAERVDNATRAGLKARIRSFVVRVGEREGHDSRLYAAAETFASAANAKLDDARPNVAARKQALIAAQAALIGRLRMGTARLSSELGLKWTSLYAVVGATLVMSGVIFWLLVAARRHRLQLETANAALQARFRTLQNTAERIAAGDLASAVVSQGDEYDDYERALEGVRADLVGKIDELDARNREVKELNAELRHQIAERSRHLARALARLSGDAHMLSDGDVFAGRYQLQAKIGAGTFGEVFRATRTSDEAKVAVKILKRVDDPMVIARFMREARILAELEHPHIVSIHDVGIAETGEAYLATELVVGPSLHAMRVRFGDAAWALPILRDIASALVAIHAEGIVHRDLKPANVVLDDTGPQIVAKLIDFGIAAPGQQGDEAQARPRIAETSPANPPPDAEQTADTASISTRGGALMGTPRYLAPELAETGSVLTAAADLFSFGVTAYRMLSGTDAFSAAPFVLAKQGLLTAPASLSAVCDDLDPRVAAVVDRCLLFEHAQRPTAEEVLRVLEEVG